MKTETKGNPTPVLVKHLRGGDVVVWADGPKSRDEKCTLWLVQAYKVALGKGEHDNATRMINLGSGETGTLENHRTTLDVGIRVIFGSFVEGYDASGEAE